MYPNNWTKIDVSGNTVFGAASDATPTADGFKIGVYPTGDIVATIQAACDADPALKQYNVTSKVESQQEVTLPDGKTKVTEVILSARVVIYDVHLYAVGTTAGDKNVVVVAYTLSSADAEKKLVKKIAQTLSIK